MQTAFAYARVSTKDQAIKGNSIPEQFARIERFAQEKGFNVLRTYQDSDSAFHDENRQEFKAMIDTAIIQKPDFIIIDDSSRFARTRQAAIETKQILRKHGVNIIFVNEPYVDPKTVAGLWLEGIQEIKNEATSREIAFHVTKGMTHNIQARDPETGWCYKNGGTAPYGYKTIYLTRGKDHKGKPILKTIWEIDSETGSIAKEIIIDMFTSRRLSYRQIRDELNERGIPSPSGEHWASSTLVEMLKENRLEQYAGTGFWNKENKHIKGVKYNPREEWVIAENAHPAIITKEELEAALERKKQNKYNAPDGATRKSTYLLTGKNYEGDSMFTCGCCGGNVIGYGNSSHNWQKYICGVNRTRGPIACSNKWLIDRNWLEEAILTQIEAKYTAPEKVDEFIKDISKKVAEKNKESDKAINTFQNELKNCDKEIKNLLEAIKKGIDASLIADEINNVKQKKEELEDKIKILKKSYAHNNNISGDGLRVFFENLRFAFDNATIEERRKLIRTFVRKVELAPEMQEIRVEFYSDSIVQSLGAGNRGRTGTVSLPQDFKSCASACSATPAYWRRHPDLNWRIKVLQTSALPLGYGAVLYLYSYVARDIHTSYIY